MHFVNEQNISHPKTFFADDRCVFMFVNDMNKLVFSTLEKFDSTQLRQFKFDKEAVKIALIPNEPLMVCSFDAPNFEYINPQSPDLNSLALINENDMHIHDQFDLMKSETICSLLILDRLSQYQNSGNKNKSVLLAVGTAFINP